MDLENFLDIERWIKNWEQYSIHVPRHLVHNVMPDDDPEGIVARKVCKQEN